MSATETRNDSGDAAVGNVDMHLEIDVIPVSDVDRAKEFYQRLGWRLDDDVAPLDGLRIVQFTPPGSGASITFGLGLTTAAPGSAEGGLIVTDIEAAHARKSPAAASTPVTSGTARRSRSRPGSPAPTPTAPATGRSSPSPIPTATRGWSRKSPPGAPAGSTPPPRPSGPARTWPARCAAPRPPTASTKKHEGRSHVFHRGEHVEDWPAWYAAYLVAEQAGTDLPA